MFINDLPDSVKTHCKIFADDTKLYSSSKSSQLLQDDIFNLFEWSHIWQLQFNIAKCKVLHIGKNNEMVDYYVDPNRNNILSNVESERDLGVIFDPNINFDLHINDCVNRAK